MRKCLFLVIVIMFIGILKSYSAQWTVSNNPNMPAQFGSVQTAIDSAAAGDTIFVYNSPNSYGNVNVTKKLHIIGAGYWGVWISGRESTNCSYTILADSVTIEGMYGSVSIGRVSPALLVKGIILKNLYMGTIDLQRVDACLIYNSICENIQIFDKNYYVENIIVSNNIINRLYNPRGSNMFVLNNIFFIDTYSSNPPYWLGSLIFQGGYGSTKYTIFQNNIFSKGSPIQAEYSSFNNNLTFNSRQNTLPYSNNNGANNIINQDPKYRGSNALDGWNSVHRVVEQNIDLRLADDSPARNAGADSTDIGISGGLYPWPRNADGTYDYSGRPRLPEIESFNLVNPIVGTDGTLRFNVKGNKAR
ncbi:MAG: hypothetical protein KGZ71_08860 [Desulfobulbaceae bacterium]|nr:hypothetical protein [Desulfobulbaceae bacterium]